MFGNVDVRDGLKVMALSHLMKRGITLDQLVANCMAELGRRLNLEGGEPTILETLIKNNCEVGFFHSGKAGDVLRAGLDWEDVGAELEDYLPATLLDRFDFESFLEICAEVFEDPELTTEALTADKFVLEILEEQTSAMTAAEALTKASESLIRSQRLALAALVVMGKAPTGYEVSYHRMAQALQDLSEEATAPPETAEEGQS